MASSLLKKLSACTNKTPDQIVALLKGGDWIKGFDMPAELWQSWRTARASVAICHYSDNNDRWQFDGSAFSAAGWRHSEITSNLHYYYFMLATEYDDTTLNPEGYPF